MSRANTLNNDHTSAKSRFFSVAIPLAMLAAVTILAYANAWPDRLVLDDKAFAGPARPPELNSLKYIFTHDIWAAVGITGGLYRPLLLLDLSLETRVFGDWLAGYHLSNIFLHLLVTFLLYGFLRHLLRITGNQTSSPDLYALLAALVFAVHPIHAEAVNSVFNRSEMLVALFGLAGLWWLLHFLGTHRGLAWLGLGIAYVLGLLSKESAAVIPGLAVVLILLLTPGDLFSRVRKCLPVLWLLLPLALYLVLRAQALAPAGPGSPGQGIESAELTAMLDMVEFPGSSRFAAVAVVLGRSLTVSAWPYPLHLYYSNHTTLLSVIYAALNVLLIGTALVQLQRHRYGLVAGLAFFYVALVPASQIVSLGDTSAHFAERYVYFPSVGLAILLAFGSRSLAQRFGPRIFVGLGMPVLLVLTALTLDRNADWANELSLFATEYQGGARGSEPLRLVTSAYLKVKDHARVVEICDENLRAQERYGASVFAQNCATAYEHQHLDKEAERAHLFAIGFETTRIAASRSLARFYLRHERREDAAKQFNAAIDWSADPADKALYRAEMIIGLHPGSREHWLEARGQLEEALRLRPGWTEAENMLQGVESAVKGDGAD